MGSKKSEIDVLGFKGRSVLRRNWLIMINVVNDLKSRKYDVG